MTQPVPGPDGVRSFSRIRHALKVEIRPLPAAEVELAAARILSVPSLDRLETPVAEPEPGQNELLDLLQSVVTRLDRLEQKVDRTLERVSRAGWPEVKTGRGPLPLEAEAFDLSGSGVGLLSPAPFDPGQHLSLILHLPGRPEALLKAIGSVATRLSVEDPAQKTEMYRLGVQFTAINEDDRQALVRFIFQRQRALLRSAHLD